MMVSSRSPYTIANFEITKTWSHFHEIVSRLIEKSPFKQRRVKVLMAVEEAKNNKSLPFIDVKAPTPTIETPLLGLNHPHDLINTPRAANQTLKFISAGTARLSTPKPLFISSSRKIGAT